MQLVHVQHIQHQTHWYEEVGGFCKGDNGWETSGDFGDGSLWTDIFKQRVPYWFTLYTPNWSRVVLRLQIIRWKLIPITLAEYTSHCSWLNYNIKTDYLSDAKFTTSSLSPETLYNKQHNNMVCIPVHTQGVLPRRTIHHMLSQGRQWNILVTGPAFL